ncbi:hypothetical protein [Burkholderia sp. B21-005]|uniref:hypothetical protein n=1 Tax=Burkholderia sp. B21-005 TaxID=2890406 RepID=UPI001E4CF03E|nr:hypothetical protein [Burkholderia sp. B21-005]UEP46592.1 hypothetical protein LMA02_32885 [Burkholderia sp. B21-005]
MDVNRNYNANAAYDWNFTDLSNGATTSTHRASGANHNAAPHLQRLQPLNRGPREPATNPTSSYNANAAYNWNVTDLRIGATPPAEAGPPLRMGATPPAEAGLPFGSHVKPKVREHIALMETLSKDLPRNYRSYINRFLCHLEQKRLTWSQLVPPGNTALRPAALEQAVSRAVHEDGLHNTTRSALNMAFGFVLEAESGRMRLAPFMPEHTAMMAALPQDLLQTYRSCINRFLCHLERLGLTWSQLVPPGNTNPRPTALEEMVTAGMKEYGLNKDTRTAINRAFQFRLRP